MSQHVSGHIGQSVSNEYGPFITIDEFRFRKSLIQAYGILRDLTKNIAGIRLTVNNVGYEIQLSADHAEKEVQKLDWLFKKEYSE